MADNFFMGKSTDSTLSDGTFHVFIAIAHHFQIFIKVGPKCSEMLALAKRFYRKHLAGNVLTVVEKK